MTDQHKSDRELRAELAAMRKSMAGLKAEKLRDLRQSEQKWHSVLCNAPIYVALVDRDATITFLNHAQPGMTIEESIGHKVFEFTHPDDHAEIRRHLAAAFEEGQTGFFTSIAAGPQWQGLLV